MKTLLTKVLYGATIGLIVAPARAAATTLDVTGNGLVKAGNACIAGGKKTRAFADGKQARAKARVLRAKAATMQRDALSAMVASGATPEEAEAALHQTMRQASEMLTGRAPVTIPVHG